MVRLVGAVLVAAGCTWLGFQAASELRRQLRSLREMSAGLALLERELELGRPPLPLLMERAAGRSSGTARLLFQRCREGLEQLDLENFSSLWRRLAEERSELTPEGQAILIPLGDILGRYEVHAQAEGLRAVRNRLDALAVRLEEENRRQGRVYQALGLSGGAFLVILLL